MRLACYLKGRKIPVIRFARATGVLPQTVYRWLAEERMPNPASMLRIEVATGGAVRPGDFYPGALHRRGCGK